jgi:hypothetical protein
MTGQSIELAENRINELTFRGKNENAPSRENLRQFWLGRDPSPDEDRLVLVQFR